MLKKVLYILWLVVFILAIGFGVRNSNIKSFIQMVEDRTFDIRQNIMVQSKAKQTNNNIVIVAVDDASYEYVLDKYGEWPLPRDIYVKVAELIEAQHPQSIAFDLMFVKSIKSSVGADEALIKLMAKYKNIFTAINFDNQSSDLRTPPILPDKLSVNVINKSPNIDFSRQSYSNCRNILDGIIKSTSNIGVTNVTRSDDGILRKMPVFIKYNDKYYPQLALKVGLKYLTDSNEYNGNDFEINSRSFLELNNRKIFIDDDGSVILNWYGGSGKFQYIPMHYLIRIVNGEIGSYDKNYFKDKIVYIGTTASSLFDIKTVPVSKTYPGVEAQATYLNNLIDNNFIIKYDKSFTVLITVLLSVITLFIVIGEASAFVGAASTISIYVFYIIISYYVMQFFNIWIDIVYPFIFAFTTFVTSYIIKYLIKSRDFDQQYKLATTDGLTELYNHRYFQEQMKQMIDLSKRYESSFSLIIIDIDFFKKFNDNFGHQSGDAVLKQVAQTLKKNVRSSDIVCRYGGEEMSIILTNTDYETALYTAQKLCTKVAEKEYKLANGKDSHVTISLGVASFPADGDTPGDLIDAADRRLYMAKNSGRNKVGE